MKHFFSKSSIYLSCSAAFILLISILNANAQVTNLSDYVMFSGNGGTGSTAPGSGGYGVMFGSSSTITGGNIGSYVLVQTTGGAVMTSNIYSGGKVILANGNSVSGRITAQNTSSLTGNILQAGSNAALSGVIDVNGNINIQSGTVTGPVHLTGAYTGPTPTSLPITNTPSFPTLPTFPAATVFPAVGATNITNTQTISPGSYGDVTFSNNKTLTLNGPGVYVFNSINLSGNNSFVYNFQNLSSGTFKIYIYGNAFLGKLNASLLNGGNAQRILWEVHGNGAGSTSGSDAVTISNGSSGGSGTVKFQGTIFAYNAGILIGSGTGSSQFTGAMISRVRVMVQTGVSLIFSAFSDCTPPVATSGSNSPICAGSTLNLTSGGGTTYSWTGPGSFSSTLQNPSIANAGTAASGVYTVTVANGVCTATSTVNATVNANPTATAGSNSPVCAGSALNLTSSGGTSYAWTGPNSFTSTSQNPSIANASIAATGTYTVTVTNAASCHSTATVSATVNANPVPTAGSNSPICAGSALNLTSSGGASYSWTGPGSFSSTSQNPSIVNAAVVATGTYTVTVTNAANCHASATVSATVNANPSPTAGSNSPVCAGNSLNLASSGGTSYAWTGPGSFSSTTQNPSIVNATIAATGTYTVTVTNAANCHSTASTTATVNTLPTADAGTNVILCGAGSAQIGSSPVAGRSYSWSPATGLSSSTVANPTVTVSTPGTTTYTVVVTNTSTSCTASASVSVTMNSALVAHAGADVNICGGGSAQLGESPAAGINYSWSPATGLSSTTVSNPTVTPSANGTIVYTVTISSTSSTCTASDQVSVTLNPLPNVSAGPDAGHDCVTTSATLSGSSTTPNAQFNWTTGTYGNIISGGTTTSPTVSVYGTFLQTSADFILTVTDPATNCTASDTATVTFTPCIFPGYTPPNNGKTDDIIGSELNFLYSNFTGTNPNPDIFVINGNQVWVDIIYNDGMYAQLYSIITSAPFNITTFGDNGTGNRIITALIDISLLQDLNNLNITTGIDLINHVRPVFPAIATAGVAYTLGDVAQRSDIARNGFNVDGEGIKVGVISNSYNTLLGNPAQTDVVNDDLPGVGNPNGHNTPVQVLQDYPYGIQTDEGRAMLQIVHDVAPKANLAFATGFISEGNMAQQVHNLQAAGCNAIVDDVTYISSPFYKDGMIAKAIQDVTAQGTTYFTSAGNFGSYSCEGTFNPAPAPGNLVGQAHDFDPGPGVDLFQNITLAPGSYLCVLQWEDEFYSFDQQATGAASDLDIYLTYDNGITLFGMNRDNNGTPQQPNGGDPVEVLSFTVTQNTSTNILIVRESGNAPITRFKYVFFKNPAGYPVINEWSQGNSTTVGHANCDAAISVGAVLYTNTPPFGVNNPTKASFSSVGGTYTEGAVRNKPDICAPNGGNTTVQLGGPNIDNDAFPNFFGTSAAAPHAAGVAALLMHGKQKYYGTTLTPADVKNLLTSTATDMYTTGFDFLSGYGLINADVAMRTFAAPTPVLVSLDNIPSGAQLGDTIPSFNLVVTANYITTQSQIVFRDDTLPTTWIDDSHLSAVIPTFFGNPPVRVCTPAITPNGNDGGCSNTLYFFSPVQIQVVVTADNKSKKFGEVMPALTASVTVDGVPLASTAYSLHDLGLDNMTFNTPATSTSNTGIYFIQPVADVSDVGLQEIYDYTFTNGLLTINKMPLLITPVNRTVTYGDKIDGTTFSFIYTYDGSNIAPAEQATFLQNLRDEYETPIIPYVALINDQTIVDGHPLANSDLSDLALICGGRALANGGRALANTGRALANNVSPDTTYIMDIAYQSLVSYNEDSSSTTLINGHPLANGGRGLVNGRPLANGHALANGRPLANGHPLANSTSLDDSSNSNVAVIIHESDIDPDSDAVITQWYPINLITGTDAGCHYSVPAAFITSNFEVTYGTASFCVNPYELKVDPQNATTEYGTAPTYSALISGLQYNDSTSFVLSGTLAFSPSNICSLNAGNHTITASGLSLVSPSNYTLTYDTATLHITAATLTATADNQSRPYGFPNPNFTISYSGFKCSDGVGNITQPTAGTTAGLLSPSGNYDITLTGGSATNYNINLVNGTLTVQPVPSCNINTPASLPVCNSSGNILSATAPAGYTYSWGVTGTGWQITNGYGTTSITYTAGANGTSGTFTLTLYAPESNIVISSCSITLGTLCGLEYCTYGQGAWGSSNGVACNGTPTSTLVPTLLSTSLVTGDGTRKITFGTGESSCLISKLPAGGTSTQLPVGNVSCANATGNQYLNNGKFKSNLLGQVIALALSVRYNSSLGSLQITGPYVSTYTATACVNGLPVPGTKQVYAIPQNVVTYLGTSNTVNDLITLANKGLGGTLPNGNNVPSLTDLANATSAMISAFSNCRILIGFSTSSQGARIENADASTDGVNNLFVYPNPSSGKTTISFVATEGSHATLDIYGINGAVVSKVLDGTVNENGLYSIDVDCSSFSRGVYFVRLAVDGEISVTKLVVIQ